MTSVDKAELLDTCLLAGRIMIEGGSEMYRVDDTMARITDNAGVRGVALFTTPTGIVAGLNNEQYVQVRQIHQREIDLEKVSRVNQLSREFAAGELSLAELHQHLRALALHVPFFPMWLQIIGAGVLSATMMIVFTQQYDWFDIPTAAVAGIVGFLVSTYINRLTNIRFVAELAGALALALVTLAACKVGWGLSPDNILIGAAMPMVPGVAITNSIRDMLAGHLRTGITRGMEAILTACAIGFGIALVLPYF